MKPVLLSLLLLLPVSAFCADLDGDGTADSYRFQRDAKVFPEGKRVNPWSESRKASGGSYLEVKLSADQQTWIIYDPEFLVTPIWKESSPPLKTISRGERGYKQWKKQAPGMKGDAFVLGTEAGIDILLYWDGKRWKVFEPAEEP